ncbi:hypothetical protein BH23VER1_BH23VER1_28650 [soil metagenome]
MLAYEWRVKLSDEQKAIVRGWADEGATLNDIQKRLKDELGLNLTYLDTRFLVSDLELQLRDPKAEEKAKAEAAAAAKAAAGQPGQGGGDAADAHAPHDGAGVTVTTDSIAQPGMMVSGKVTFSDGQVSQWYLDQTGQLGLVPDVPGYQPTEADIIVFQRELRSVLQGGGLA